MRLTNGQSICRIGLVSSLGLADCGFSFLFSSSWGEKTISRGKAGQEIKIVIKDANKQKEQMLKSISVSNIEDVMSDSKA